MHGVLKASPPGLPHLQLQMPYECESSADLHVPNAEAAIQAMQPVNLIAHPHMLVGGFSRWTSSRGRLAGALMDAITRAHRYVRCVCQCHSTHKAS